MKVTFKMKVCFLYFAKHMTFVSVVKVSTFVYKIVLIKRKCELTSRWRAVARHLTQNYKLTDSNEQMCWKLGMCDNFALVKFLLLQLQNISETRIKSSVKNRAREQVRIQAGDHRHQAHPNILDFFIEVVA